MSYCIACGRTLPAAELHTDYCAECHSDVLEILERHKTAPSGRR